jgi:hypothetical protein
MYFSVHKYVNANAFFLSEPLCCKTVLNLLGAGSSSGRGGFENQIRAMLHSAEKIFRQFVAEYFREFETEFENILGC